MLTLLTAAPLFAQLQLSGPVYIDADPSARTDGFNPYPGLGTVPNERNAASSPMTLYADENDGATFGLPMCPTSAERDSQLFLSSNPKGRQGVFQKANIDVLWANRNGDNGLGFTQFDLSATFAMPFPVKESPLILTPKFQTWFFDSKYPFDGYTSDGNYLFTNRSPSLFTTGLDIRWIKPLVKNKYFLDLGITPQYSGDFKSKRTKDVFRYPGHIAGIWQYNPRTKIVLGVLYLQRTDQYNWLPMGGIIWTPNEDVDFQLVFPRIKISQRIQWWGSTAGDRVSDWLYCGFELDGGAWGAQATEYDFGDETYETRSCKLQYSDYRLLLGYERRTQYGISLALEVGWMFARTMEVVDVNKLKPNDAFFLRLRTSY